ncbi:hypothetical protein ES703_42667 [subsurface metagenome]
MSLRIPLPKVRKKPNCKAHPFPFQIGFQTLEFIQSSIFFTTLLDYISGEYLEQQTSLEKIKIRMIEDGLSDDNWEKDFACLMKYRKVFEKWIFQNVLIQIKSHWDWYIRRLAEFIVFARENVSSSPLNQKDKAELQRIGFKPLSKQLRILENAGNVKFNIPKDILNALSEMALVRNIGLHNRWEIDSFYLSKTNSSGWNIGEIREFNIIELGQWHKCIMTVIHETSVEVSKKFVYAPDYPDVGGSRK